MGWSALSVMDIFLDRICMRKSPVLGCCLPTLVHEMESETGEKNFYSDAVVCRKQCFVGK